MESNIYARFADGELMQLAKIKKLMTGNFAYSTSLSLFGEKSWVCNMNMPLFDTYEEAKQWIENNSKWELYKTT